MKHGLIIYFLLLKEETKDIDLFAPITEREECPICMLVLPLYGVTFFPCCGKRICDGCTNKVTDAEKNGKPLHELKCAFCQQLMIHIHDPKSEIKALKRLLKKNNCDAFMQMSSHYERGDGVFQSDTKALEMRIRAAELGNPNAYAIIGNYYRQGKGVEQDKSKTLEYLKVAAKKGSIEAHQTLARCNVRNGNFDKGMRHWRVAASAGDQDSMDDLMKAYKAKLLSKEELTQTLRAFQTSSNELKSKDRDEARVISKEWEEKSINH